MGDLFHFLIVAFRYFTVSILVMSSLLVGLILLDLFILHPESSSFSLSTLTPLLVIISILLIVFVVVKRMERKIEAAKKNKN